MFSSFSRRDPIDPITRIRFYLYDGRSFPSKLIGGNLENSVSDSRFSVLTGLSLSKLVVSNGEG